MRNLKHFKVDFYEPPINQGYLVSTSDLYRIINNQIKKSLESDNKIVVFAHPSDLLHSKELGWIVNVDKSNHLYHGSLSACVLINDAIDNNPLHRVSSLSPVYGLAQSSEAVCYNDEPERLIVPSMRAILPDDDEYIVAIEKSTFCINPDDEENDGERKIIWI